MAYKITGRVMEVGQTQSLTSKNGTAYTKRDVVITVRKFDPYTGIPSEEEGNTPKFTFFGERCKDLDDITPGIIVNISFEITGREYTKDGKTDYFTEVKPLRISRQPSVGMPADAVKTDYVKEAANAAGIRGYEGEPTPAETIKEAPASNDDDDLPF